MNNNIKKTAVIVAPYFPPHTGGLERYVFEIANHLHHDYQWRVVVVTSGERYGTDTKEEVDNITIYRLAYKLKISNTPFSFSWLRKVRNILKSEKPEIINIHTPVAGIGDIAALFAKKIPNIVTYHAGSMHKKRLFPDVFIWLYEHGPLHYLLRRADRIICSSDHVRFNFLNKYFYKSSTITPAVDANIFKPALEKKTVNPTILFVAGLNYSEQHKGLQYLIDAIKNIQQQIPNIRLNVVGDGDMKSEYKKRVENLGLSEVIIFKGRLFGEELVKAYQEANLFVLPTTNDSYATVIIEAMSCGLPVVTTTVGSLSSLVDNEKTGYLINPEDLSAQLAPKIIKILTNKKLEQELGAEGLKKIKQGFSWTQRAEKYNQAYVDLIGQNSEQKIRITITTPYFFPKIGGVENYALTVARGLQATGKYLVSIITTNHESKGYRQEIIEDMTVHRLPILFKISNTPFNFTWYWWLKKILKTEKPDIIHTHSPVPYMSDITVLAAKKTPVLMTYHSGSMKKGNWLTDIMIIFYEWIVLPIIFSKVSQIVVVSQSFAKNKLAKFLDKIHFIAPSVDTYKFISTPMPTNSQTVTFVGRIEHNSNWKGIEVLLRAMSLVIKKFPNAKLEFVGGGDAVDFYQQKAKDLGIEKSVVWRGMQKGEALIKAYQNTNMVVLPSISESESFGTVLIEALASGRPVIGSNIGGIPQVIDHEKTGLLATPNNPELLAEAICRLLSDSSFAEKLAKQGREKVEREFTSEIQVKKYADLFQRMLNKESLHSQQLNVVHIVPCYPPHMGGMELRVQDLAKRQASLGLNVKILTSNTGTPTGKYLKDKINIHYLRSFKILNTPIALGLFWELWRVKKDDIIHLHVAQSFFPEVVAVVCALRRIPYIAHIRALVTPSGFLGRYLLPIYRQVVLKYVLRQATKIIVLTPDYKEIINKEFKIPLESIVVIPNATTFTVLTQPKKHIHNPLRLLAVGRISAQKNYLFMLQSVALLKKIHNINFQLTIVGDGQGKKRLEDEASALNIKENVKLIGEKTGMELEKIYEEADLFLLTSVMEGFGTVLIEAMAKGLPIVATDIPGTRNVAKQDHNAILTNFSPESTSNAIAKLMSDSDLYQTISQNNLNDVKKYNWDTITEQTLKLYQTINRKFYEE